MFSLLNYVNLSAIRVETLFVVLQIRTGSATELTLSPAQLAEHEQSGGRVVGGGWSGRRYFLSLWKIMTPP